MAKLNRVVLEIGLRPFDNMSLREIERVCRHALSSWSKLIEQGETISVLFWTGNGDEIVQFDGNMNKEVNWGKYIGFCNLDSDAYPVDVSHYRNNTAFLYRKNPPVIKYKDLKVIVATFKRLAKEMFNKKLTAGLTYCAGPEFVFDTWRFKLHPEIITNGPKSKYKRTMAFVDFTRKLHADTLKYAGYPEGLPEGTPFGEFLGRQTRLTARALGFDYIWFSNGFGFTPNSWYTVGKVFDGGQYYPGKVKQTAKEILDFWREFKKECPALPIEIRGTDFNVGLDIAKDAVPLRDIYKIGKVKICAPNPPWGSRNLGQEIAIFLSRIAELPGNSYPYRFYVEDPWFVSRPWIYYYNREPYDIYSALSAARIDAKGKIKNPTDIELLSISSERGDISEKTANEIIPHMRRAMEDFPTAPGIAVWVYPYHEYNDMIEKHPELTPMLNLNDVYINEAVSQGLPLNTVISTTNFMKLKDPLKVFGNNVLIVPVALPDWKYANRIISYVKKGGKALFYGNTKYASEKLRNFLNLSIAEPLEGELKPTGSLQEDIFKGGIPKRVIIHRGLLSAGGVHEILKKKEKCTKVKVSVTQNGKKRIYALIRKQNSWKGGMAGWIRGTLPFESRADQVSSIGDDQFKVHNTGEWLRHMLGEFGFSIKQERINIGQLEAVKDPTLAFVSNQKVQMPLSSPVVLFISRSRGAYFLNGHKPDSTVVTNLSFPEGAPVATERETIVENNSAKYTFDKSFHYECRVFVKQKECSVILVKQRPPRPVEVNRKLDISGLKKATVTVYCDPENFNTKLLKVITLAGKQVAFKIDKIRKVMVIENTSEDISVMW